MKTLLCIVTITGLCALSLCHTRQYHFVYDKMNWTDAQQYCREKFKDLATIDSMEDFKTLKDMVDKGSVRQLGHRTWIGLYEDINSWRWRWSLADERFYKDAEEREFRKWTAATEPSRNEELCAAMYGEDGEWRAQRNCAKRMFPICFNDTDPIGKHFIIFKLLTWAEAQRACRQKHTDLASVRNQKENEEIQKIMSPGGAYWIGLFRDSWEWSDGGSSSFRAWNTGEPNGDGSCAALGFGNGSKWADWSCGEKATFICNRVPVPVKKVQVLRVKLTKANSSLDLDNPKVQKAILEQFKQSLKGHEGDIKLKWLEQADGKIFHKEDKKKKKEKKKRERKPVLTKREL